MSIVSKFNVNINILNFPNPYRTFAIIKKLLEIEGYIKDFFFILINKITKK